MTVYWFLSFTLYNRICHHWTITFRSKNELKHMLLSTNSTFSGTKSMPLQIGLEDTKPKGQDAVCQRLSAAWLRYTLPIVSLSNCWFSTWKFLKFHSKLIELEMRIISEESCNFYGFAKVCNPEEPNYVTFLHCGISDSLLIMSK